MKTAAAVSDGAHRQLVAIVAHELRHPLVPIQNAAALLQRDSLDPATIRRAAEIIERQVNGMNRLIGDLVEVSRMQMGGLELQLARAPLSELMERVAETATPILTERGQELLVCISPEPVYLNMDVLRVGQALHNIIGSASKHGNIYVRAQREGGQAVIVVSDLGRDGDPEPEIDQDFELKPGIGLGLYLAQYLVEAHAGTVTAESGWPERRCVFTVRMPCEASTPPSDERAGAGPAGDPFPA